MIPEDMMRQKYFLRHLETFSYFQDILSRLQTTEEILKNMSIDASYGHVLTDQRHFGGSTSPTLRKTKERRSNVLIMRLKSSNGELNLYF